MRKNVHGATKTSEWVAWCNIRRRCENPNHHKYAIYGARGIKVCERWHRFEHFLADMGPRPSSAHSIDRIKNSGNYEPGNCRWATRSEQASNTRSNQTLTFGGRTQTVTQWARELGIEREALRARMRHGWSAERVLTEPVNQKRAHRRKR